MNDSKVRVQCDKMTINMVGVFILKFNGYWSLHNNSVKSWTNIFSHQIVKLSNLLLTFSFNLGIKINQFCD